MLTIKEAANELDLSPGRIHQLIHEGKIKAKKYGPVYLIKKEDLKSATWNRKPGPKTRTS